MKKPPKDFLAHSFEEMADIFPAEHELNLFIGKVNASLADINKTTINAAKVKYDAALAHKDLPPTIILREFGTANGSHQEYHHPIEQLDEQTTSMELGDILIARIKVHISEALKNSDRENARSLYDLLRSAGRPLSDLGSYLTYKDPGGWESPAARRSHAIAQEAPPLTTPKEI
ncbi:MAG: hypothetical protein DHS20C02_06140 [Micavibrio sp.]|nr:MAG: hypothetical protein DHS20C02_06140 [Micavibrio sp.]